MIHLETADDGDIQIEDRYLLQGGHYVEDRTAQSICSKMGMVFQNFNLSPIFQLWIILFMLQYM